ncbi:unnamed protein product [Pleuronectes platessa]|uniref:Uncharacterized protein n=1 Tax=Pleuronectes platessa TaxID=8262 RepID=A0A9N7V711_PLEPL|nr:unnamed protein product [Pleuronectes platessa]
MILSGDRGNCLSLHNSEANGGRHEPELGDPVAEGLSSSNLKVGGSIPSLNHLHAEVSLGKMLNPEWPPIE